jgi:hypothetical protein
MRQHTGTMNIERISVFIQEISLRGQNVEGMTNSSSSSFAEVFAFLKILVKFASSSILKYQINSFLIIEIAIKPEYVGVTKMRLNLNFSSELMFNLGLLKLALEKNL